MRCRLIPRFRDIRACLHRSLHRPTGYGRSMPVASMPVWMIVFFTFFRGSAVSLSAQRSGSPAPLTNVMTEFIYQRTARIFQGARFFKPPEDISEAGLAAELCPLVLMALGSEENPQSPPWEYAAAFTEGREATGSRKFTLHAWESKTRIYGQTYAQWTYAWGYRRAGAPSSTAWKFQGIRITLNQNRMPVIWEIIKDSSGLHLIYVARSLEESARQVLGPALPGRRFVVEPARDSKPGVMVPGTLDDAPIAFGPWLYVLPDTMDIAVVLCRCMDAQVIPPIIQGRYQFQFHARSPFGISPPDNFPVPPDLESSLRLPPTLNPVASH